MLYIIIGVVLFGLLIAVHEAGHFLAAKRLDVQVNEFSIGMGPGLFSRQKGETLYSLRLFPVGGYCAMEGENGEEGEEPNPRSFAAKSLWKKLVILVAGSAANFLAGFLLVAFLFTWAGGYTAPVIQGFLEGFPYAGQEGLLPGDRILSIDGKKVWVYNDVGAHLKAAGEGPKDILIERDGQEILLEDFPLDPQEYDYNGKRVTMYGLTFQREEATLSGILAHSWNTCVYFAKAVWSSLGMLVTGQVGLQDMSGPVGIVTVIEETGSQSDSVKTGIQNVCYLIALIAVNLAIMNMLPIPALDGGRIFLLVAAELLWLTTRQRLDPKYEAWLNAAGFVLLLALMVFVTFSDVLKLFH